MSYIPLASERAPEAPPRGGGPLACAKADPSDLPAGMPHHPGTRAAALAHRPARPGDDQPRAAVAPTFSRPERRLRDAIQPVESCSADCVSVPPTAQRGPALPASDRTPGGPVHAEHPGRRVDE
jgi:hypothetical protein